MAKTIMTIKTKEAVEKPRYNAYQSGYGVHISDKYKKKGRRHEKDRKEMKDWCRQ